MATHALLPFVLFMQLAQQAGLEETLAELSSELQELGLGSALPEDAPEVLSKQMTKLCSCGTFWSSARWC